MPRHEVRQVMQGGAVVIPREIRDELGISDGDHVEFEHHDGEVVLRRGAASQSQHPTHRARETHRGHAGHGGDETGISPNKIQSALKGMDYPAQKQDLIAQARKNRAAAEINEILERFPDQEYGGPQDVMKAFGSIDTRS